MRYYELLFGVMVTKTWRDHLGSTSVSFPMWLWVIGLTLAHKPPLFMTGILSRPTVELRPTESTPEFSFKFKGAAHFHAVGVSTCLLLLTHADGFKRRSVPSSSHRTTRNRPKSLHTKLGKPQTNQHLFTDETSWCRTLRDTKTTALTRGQARPCFEQLFGLPSHPSQSWSWVL